MARYAEEIIYALELAGADALEVLNDLADGADRAHEAISELSETGGSVGEALIASTAATVASLDEITEAAESADVALGAVGDDAAGAGTGIDEAADAAAGLGKGLGSVAGGSSSATKGLGGFAAAIAVVSPRTAKVVRGVSGLLKGVKALSPVLAGASTALAGVAAVAVPVGVALAAIGTVAIVVANHTAESREEMAAFKEVLAQTDEITRNLIASQGALKLASGDTDGFIADLHQQMAKLNGDISDADILAGTLGGKLADQLNPEIKAAADAWAESDNALQKLKETMNDPDVGRKDRDAAIDAFTQLEGKTITLREDLEALKTKGREAREAINAYTQALEEAAKPDVDPPAGIAQVPEIADAARVSLERLISTAETLTAPRLTQGEQLAATLDELQAAASRSDQAAVELAPSIQSVSDALAELADTEASATLDGLVSSVAALTAPDVSRLEELEATLATLQAASGESEEAFWRLGSAIENVQDAINAEELRLEIEVAEQTVEDLAEVHAQLVAVQEEAQRTRSAFADALGVGAFTDAIGGLTLLRSGFQDLFAKLRSEAGGLREELREAGSGLLDGLQDSKVGSLLSGLADDFGDKLSQAFSGLSGGGEGDEAGGAAGGGGGLLAAAGSIPEPVTQAVTAVLSAASQIGAAGNALEAELAAARESGDTDRVAEIEAAISQYGSASGAAVAESMEETFDGLLDGLAALPEVLGSVVLPELIKMAPQIIQGVAKALFLLPFEIAGAIFNGIGDIFEEGLGNALKRWWESTIDNIFDIIDSIIHPFQKDDDDGKPATASEIAAQVAAYEANQTQEQEQAAQSSFLGGSNASSARSSDDAQLRRLYKLLLPDTEPGGELTIGDLNRAAGGGVRRALAGRQESEGGGGGRSVNITINTDIADADTMRRETRRLENTESTLRRVPPGSLGRS